MLTRQRLALGLGCILSTPILAGSMGDEEPNMTYHPWLAIASIGYTSFQDTGSGSGQTVLGRFAIGKELYDWGNRDISVDNFNPKLPRFGVEFAVQNGARLTINTPESNTDELGGLPVLTNLRPIIDLLGTFTINPMENKPLFMSVKAGFAYRQWQMDYQYVNNVYQINGEFQAGLGMSIGESSAISVMYQGIYNANPSLTVTQVESSALVKNIPSQNGVLLSLSVFL